MRPFLAALLLALPPTAAPAQEEIRAMGRCAGCTVTDGDHSGARLIGLDLTDAVVTRTRFDGARLAMAVFDGAVLEGVRFDGADLDGASFVGARLIGASFVDADLSGAVFDGAVLIDTDLSAARRCQTQMPDDAMANEDCGAN